MPSKALKNNLTQANTPVPQTQKAAKGQKPNSAGGFTFVVSDKDRLTRFLILGTDGGTYYVNEQKLTDKNVDFIVKLIKENPELVLNTVVEVSSSGRAYRNSQAIFVLSLLFKHANKQFKETGRLNITFNQTIRTSTHLFEFAEYVELLGGWGRAKRDAVARWYTGKTPDQLAYQAVKYRQRDGWTHRDLFRLSHPKGVDNHVGSFILGKPDFRSDPGPQIIYGFQSVQQQTDIAGVTHVLDLHKNLPWETVPTQFHKSPELWKKLFDNGELKGQALLRQITRLARLGMFNDMVFAREYAGRLIDAEMIAKTKLHPIQYLLALIGHVDGQVVKGAPRGGFTNADSYRTKDWTVSPIIRDALDEGYLKAFGTIEPANKRTLIGVDVSGSMSSLALGIDLSCAQVAGAMAMVTARTEPYYAIHGFSNTFQDLGISASMGLPDVLRQMQRMTMGSTDCSMPIEHAIAESLAVDTFVVITDNETYQGRRHPHVALQDYRQRTGIDAKLVVMAVTATKSTIADPSDRGMLDVCGCDTNVPRLLADFSAGRI